MWFEESAIQVGPNSPYASICFTSTWTVHMSSQGSTLAKCLFLFVHVKLYIRSVCDTSPLVPPRPGPREASCED